MNRQVSVWAFSLGLVLAACSGRVDVGVEPGDGGSDGVGGVAGSGVLQGNAGSAPAAGSAPTGPANDGTPNPCSFFPLQATDARPLLSSANVLARIFQFLEDDLTIPTGALPDEPTPAWAAARAEAILDEHQASGTPAPGLTRFLEHWLGVMPDELEAPSTWALKLVAPDATLSTLLAEPTGEPHRFGILNEAEVLTLRPGITERGSLINGRVLCQTIPAPPPSQLHSELPVDDGTATRRERLALSIASPVCAACHALADPSGYSLEHFDEMGDYRELDNGKAVDASGTLTNPPISFQDYADLAPQLASSCEAAHCFSTLLGRDALGAPLFADLGDLSEADVNRIARDFVASGYSIRALVDAIVGSPSFRR